MGGAKTIITFYCFSGFPCLNVNHVNTKKDFHNVFAYYGRSKPKKKNVKEITIFNFI
jgi:hypothetical protein